MKVNTSHTSGMNLATLLYELVFHSFVPISCMSYVQERLCYFALKAYFDMLHFVIYIHRNPKILVFISQIITIKID